MTSLTAAVVRETAERMRGDGGINFYLGSLLAADGSQGAILQGEQIIEGQASIEIAESGPQRYPQVFVYCDKLTNSLREKFRTFSGTARMVVEARVSNDRAEVVDVQSQNLVESVTSVLSGSRGEWRTGVSYAGGYEVTYAPVKAGGKRYVKTAKVVFDVDLSLN